MISVVSPTSAEAGPCHEFPWEQISSSEEPISITEARTALSQGLKKDASELLRTFIRMEPTHELIEAARFSLASMVVDGPGEEDPFLETIGNLRAARQRYPDSALSPWALCRMGDLYREGGWFYEAKGAFEQFLKSYPDHPLTPGVLLGAGLNFLKNQQSLEAALVFRRVLDEPKWYAFHLEAALGLADGAAASKAWEQARYWYETVALEAPELLRASSGSLFLRGLTEGELGNMDNSFTQFLTAFNLYPNDQDGGRALIQLARLLSEQGKEVPALWFANQAIQRFPRKEPEYVGRGVILGWAFLDLRKGSDAVFHSEVRSRLAELGIAVPVTWNEFRGEAAKLAMVTKPEISGMARFWIAQSHDIQGRPKEALQGYVEVVVNYSGTTWETQAAESAKHLLAQFHGAGDWVSLLSFFDTYPGIFALLKPDPRMKLMIADGYLSLHLPTQALAWFDRVLDHGPPPIIEEDALGKKVYVAEQLGLRPMVKEAGLQYERYYPDGPHIIQVASSLGRLAIADKDYAEAQEHYSKVLSHVSLLNDKRIVLRKVLDMFRKSGQLEKSIEGYERLIRDYGMTAEDTVGLGDVLFEAGRYQEAIGAYVRLGELDPSAALQIWGKYRLALSYKQMGNMVLAKQLLNELIGDEHSGSRLEKAIQAAAFAQESGFRLMVKNGKGRSPQN